MKNNISEILKKDWIKNWSGNWSLLFASFYGDNYTKGLKTLVGKGFDNNLITFENGVSSNYLPQGELDNLGRLFAEQVSKQGTAEKWAKLVFERTDKVMELISELDKKVAFEKGDYFLLRDVYEEHVPPNFAIKKVADYLSSDLMEKYLELFSKVRVYTEPVYGEISRMLTKVTGFLTGISSDLIPLLTKKEVEKFIGEGQQISIKDLEERKKGCAFLFDSNGEVTYISEIGLKEINESLIGKKDVLSIKGQIAYKGIAKGIVRIILDPFKYKIFNDGDILVTGMTRPEYLSLMQKSGAFVTDAGGLLSHAAIVARELKKPCIIGTKIATKVLKGGDLVEVDANSGKVTILKRE
ncbi:MAG: PEP-utilizing enzyme [Patescibacteria group bacterium]